MITESLVKFFTGFVNFFVGLLPDADAPDWMYTASNGIQNIWGYAAGLSAWIPFQVAATVVSAVLVCVGIGFTIKVARIVASFLTVGGGSAG